ncbi:hypothetical protein [Streptomyces sp. NBC_00847]|uniref:hypothetical protein n=1 Tax=Streptomyces sp. NBC_00847 TaxID=2975850 RepID=UPI00225DE7E4|nr:hypothetical protein [Streptomyces sp. NBC_00847]MCX4886006.1 hypothetical protein [Streptomyces sp. NBC_00847]
MRKSVIRSVSPYQVLMSAPTHRSLTLHALTADALGPKFGKCRDCHGFERVVTQTGVAICDNPMHAETKPQLPTRPTPHERDGRQNPPAEPARPRSRAALLVG